MSKLLTTNQSTDIVIVSVPYTDTFAPIMAPAALKGSVIAAGYSCAAFDLNAVVVNVLKDHPNKLEFLEFVYFDRVINDAEHEIVKLFDLMVDRIMEYNPKTVALSLLHYQCQTSCKWLCFRLKQRFPDVKIVIGGAGVAGQLASSDQSFCEHLKNLELVDHYIHGDGEFSLVEFLKGNLSFPGIDSLSWEEIQDLNSIEYPDYDNYDFALYDSPFIGINGSRGCVRQCTFCDIHEHWTKFRWRTGESIFNEMLHQNRKYGTRFFKFQDSLINGNVKEYTSLIKLLAEYNINNPDNSFYWSSYYIFRPTNNWSEDLWKLTAQSGAYTLSVGIESLVEKNRNHMKKKFSNNDIDFSLAMAKKYKIKLYFLMIVGYVTETDEDHKETLQWLRDHKNYAKDPIYQLCVGGTLSILPNTWLDRNQKRLGIIWLKGDDDTIIGNNHLWSIPDTGNTYRVRTERLKELIEVGKECGFDIHRSVIDPQKELENIMHDRMKRYYELTGHV